METDLIQENGQTDLNTKEGEDLINAAQEWRLSRKGDGTEHPRDLSSNISHNTLERTFCFIDMANFTQYTRKEGPAKALDLVENFRALTRAVAAARGVRVAKWLGDGVLLVSTKAGPCIATAAHLATHFAEAKIQMRIGIATGRALLLGGDDYVGEPLNLASKLCLAAKTGQILANVEKDDLPDWVELIDEITVDIRNIGRVGGIFIIKAKDLKEA